MNAASPAHMRLFAQLHAELKSGARPARPAAGELPTSLYLDEARLRRERALAFAAKPVIVGHAAMIPDPGDHYAHDHLGKPLLLVRGRDGDIRVFLNVCRHRGMRLVVKDGVSRKLGFVCPYHQWSYDLDGKLKNAPLAESFEGADLSCRNLTPVPSGVRGGFIFARIDGSHPLDLDDHLGEIAADLEAFETATHVLYEQTTTVKKANWKLIVEAFQDGYHVVRLHRNSVGPFFIDGRAAIERIGLNLRAAVARQEFADILDAPPSAWNDRIHVSFAHFIFPNTIIVVHPDYISHLGLFPQAVDETIVVHTCLIPKKPKTQKEREHWARAFDIIENGVFQAEDLFVCEQAQIGMASGANETLLLSGHEYGIALFHDILDEVLEKGASEDQGAR